MRRILVVMLLASLCQGCFVLEEIDKGHQIMEQHSPRAREKRAQEEEASARRSSARAGAGEQTGTLDELQEWWKKKREPAPPERDPEDVVVRCQVGGSVQFARKFDCMLRGGRPL
jgi:hypothetical protein